MTQKFIYKLNDENTIKCRIDVIIITIIVSIFVTIVHKKRYTSKIKHYTYIYIIFKRIQFEIINIYILYYVRHFYIHIHIHFFATFIN